MTPTLDQRCDALGAGDTNRAHLRPDRTRRERVEHALVRCDRHDRIGVRHHRDHDPCARRRGCGGVCNVGAEVAEILRCFGLSVPHNCRESGTQRARRHPVTHRSDTEKRHGLML
jgi:hypothetical protein